jgi:uncharacterized repeat protein (TIGR01451 family)
VVITDTLPTGMSYLTDTLGIAPSEPESGTIVWDLGQLDGGVESFFDVFVEVGSTITPGTRVTNVVDIATPDVEPNTGNNHHAWWTDVISNDTYLNVDKGAWTGDPAPGYEVVFNVNVCNNGSTASSQVVVTDTLHPSMTLQSWWGQHDGWTQVLSESQRLVVSRPSAPDGWCGEVYVQARVTDTAWSGLWISNTATISASNDLEDNDNESTWSGHVNDPHTNVRVDKWWGGGELVPGGQIRFHGEYQNNGNVPVSGVQITETLPVSTTLVEWRHYDRHWNELGVISPTLVPPSQIVWDVGEVVNGHRGNFEVVLQIDSAPDAVGSVLTNTVQISPQPDEDDYGDNSATVVDQVYGLGPNLRVSKEGEWWDEGDLLRYHIDIENVGSETAHDVWITDTLPTSTKWSGWWNAGLDWSRFTAFRTGGELSVSAPELISSSLQNLWFVEGAFGGSLTRGQIYTYPLASSEVVSPSNAEGCNPWPAGTFTGTAALIKRGTCQFGTKALYAQQAGAEVVIIYNQAAQGDGVGVMLGGEDGDQVVIPAVAIGHTDGHGMVNWCEDNPDNAEVTLDPFGSGVVEWQVDQLDPGEMNWLELEALLDDPDTPRPYTNTVEISTPAGDPGPDDNTHQTVHTSGPDLWVEKSLVAGELLPGEVITFSLRFGNNKHYHYDHEWWWNMEGTAWLTDTLPEGLDYVTSTQSCGQGWCPAPASTDDGVHYVWELWPLTSGSWNEIRLTARVTDTATGLDTFTNAVEIASDQPISDTEPYYYNNVDAYALPIALPHFEVSKAYQSSRIAGSPVTYTLTVTNTGHVSGTNVVLSDTLPAGLTYGGGGSFDGSDVTWTFDTGAGEVVDRLFTATLPCSGTVSNDDYRVVSSDQGVTSTAGSAVDLDVVAPALVADFDQSEDTITVNDTVIFTDASTTNGPAITDWQWDFGDGSAKATTQDASHQYTSADVFTVTLTITDDCGYSASHTGAVTVASEAEAGFTASPTVGVAPLTVTFTNTSTGGYGTSLWAFGDGVTSTEESPTHTYAYGLYTVSLTVDVGLPGADTLTRTNYITASHEADVTYDCVVDVEDVQAVAGNWRCEEGDLCYYEHQDLDGDKIITVIDIMKVVAHWDWTCWGGPPAGPTMLPPWWWDGGG